MLTCDSTTRVEVSLPRDRRSMRLQCSRDIAYPVGIEHPWSQTSDRSSLSIHNIFSSGFFSFVEVFSNVLRTFGLPQRFM